MTEIPDFVAARDHVRDELVRFVRALRRAGVAVPANAGTTAGRALVEVGFEDSSVAQAALRACLVSNPADVATFDRQFPEFWRRLTSGLDAEGPAPRRDGPEGALAPLGDPAPGESDPEASDRESAMADESSADDDDEGWRTSNSLGALVSRHGEDGEDAGETEAAWYSPTGTATPVSSGAVGGADDVERAFDELTAALSTLRGRRWRVGGDERPDVRRALRSSFGTGGTVVTVPRRERRPSAVRATLLVDVSQSVLDTVDRSFLLGALRRARADWRDARVFFFDEDVREVSTAFDEETPGEALAALERAEAEWGGGTRIGRSLAALHEETPEAVDRRTVVFVVSDGLEMGDVDELERELSWLARHAAAVLWLNPLAASPAYEPTARGMAAAFPFVDGVFAFAEPDDLAEIGRQLRRQGASGRIGYEYDTRRRGAS